MAASFCDTFEGLEGSRGRKAPTVTPQRPQEIAETKYCLRLEELAPPLSFIGDGALLEWLPAGFKLEGTRSAQQARLNLAATDRKV